MKQVHQRRPSDRLARSVAHFFVEGDTAPRGTVSLGQVPPSDHAEQLGSRSSGRSSTQCGRRLAQSSFLNGTSGHRQERCNGRCTLAGEWSACMESSFFSILPDEDPAAKENATVCCWLTQHPRPIEADSRPRCILQRSTPSHLLTVTEKFIIITQSLSTSVSVVHGCSHRLLHDRVYIALAAWKACSVTVVCRGVVCSAVSPLHALDCAGHETATQHHLAFFPPFHLIQFSPEREREREDLCNHHLPPTGGDH